MHQGASSLPTSSSSWSASTCKNDNGYDFYYMATISTKVNKGTKVAIKMSTCFSSASLTSSSFSPLFTSPSPNSHITSSVRPFFTCWWSWCWHSQTFSKLERPNNSILSQARSPRTTQRQDCCVHCRPGSAPHQPRAEVKGWSKEDIKWKCLPWCLRRKDMIVQKCLSRVKR